MKINACEGDLIEDFSGVIFDVKGFVHPPARIVAFIRFVPDIEGSRIRQGVAYRKVYGLSERYELLKKVFPQYLVYDSVFDENLCEVPIKNVKNHYQPAEHLETLRQKDDLDDIENQALEFVMLLKENANVPWSKLGTSGSILARLHTPTSDIDPVVYGSQSCRQVYEALKALFKKKKSHVRAYAVEELKGLFDFRSKDTQMLFEDFVRTESRKVLQGKFKQRDYFIRFVKDWNEIDETYGSILYKNVGYAKIVAKVVDDADSIFTPCTYKVDDVKILEGQHFKPIKEIVSFRGRFCEQARNGETVIAQGKLERVQKKEQKEYYRLLLGNKPTDYMIPT